MVVCEGPLLDAKMAALDGHASQTRPLRAMVGDAVYREWFRIEAFADASRASLRASEQFGAASDVLVGARA